MDKTKIMLSFASGALLLLSGCGSDSTNTGGTTPVANNPTAFYVDSAIEGVTVECSASSSVTNSDGAFSYEAGSECQFRVGTVFLRTEAGLTEGQIVFEDNVRTAQFLQTLDIDGNPENGITITAESTTVPQSDVVLAELEEAMDLADIGYHGKYVTSAEAKAHMEQSYEIYFGQPLYPNVPDTPNTPNVPNTPDVPNVPDRPEIPHM